MRSSVFSSARSSRARHRARPTAARSFRGIIGAASAIAGATLVAAALSGGSYALWSTNANVDAGSVSSGTAGINVSNSFVASQWSNLLVGESVRQPFTVTNSGSVPLTMTATATSAAGYEIRVARGACVGQLAGTAASAAATSLSTLAAGANATVCLEVRLVAGAVAGSSVPFVVTVTGVQA